MFLSAPRPTEKDEVWRYSRIDQLDLDRFSPADTSSSHGGGRPGPSPSDRVHSLVSELGARAALVVTIDGALATVASELGDEILRVGRIAETDEVEPMLGSVADAPRDFVALNDAFVIDPVVVEVQREKVIEDPVVIVHLVSGGAGAAVFPRTVIHACSGSTIEVVEFVVEAGAGFLADESINGIGPSHAPEEQLVVPVTELAVDDGASLSFVSIQALGPKTWQLAHHASAIGAGATLSSFAVSLGGGYARLRTDSALQGEGGSSVLRAAYVGRDDQMLDFRTLQDHLAPRTTSDLVFMGAVAEQSHSVYSGLIRVRRGAVRSDAMQTNRNLVLDEGAHADSVPNLDIEENDVRCSHASTVGPIDEDQRYYLESRGIEPEEAEQLIVSGFFNSIADQIPIAGAREFVRVKLADRIGVLHG